MSQRSQGSQAPAQPDSPLTASQRGYGMALAALFKDVFEGEQRLLWCVDLKRDVGIDHDETTDPSAPEQSPTKWGAILSRFKAFLDNQPHIGQQCRIGMLVRYSMIGSGKPVLLVFDLPWGVSLPQVTARKPGTGVWRVWACPAKVMTHPHNTETHKFEGDLLPDSFWFDGIPF